MVIKGVSPIRITRKQKKLLNKLKIHKSQPYHEVLENILGDYLLIRENKK